VAPHGQGIIGDGEAEHPNAQALRESEKRFRMLADNISQLAWTCDLLGNVTWYNKRWLDYTGLTFEDMKGWGWSKVQHPDHVDRVVARVERSAESGEPWEDTFPLRGKDGEFRWFLSRAMPIRDEQGNFVQWFGTNTDVTAQVLAEQLVARQAEELRALNERLQELDRAKTSFFSNVSHEFRTPLTLMLGPLEDLKAEFRRSASPLSSHQYQQLDLVHRNSVRLLKLTNALLDFARIEAGRVQAMYEPTDLAAFTAELASVFRSAVEKAGLEFAVHCPPLCKPAFVDREMWEKIVLNLISNAFKFTFEGEIEVSLRQTDTRVELAVRDTGIGITANELPKLFDRFHRVAGAQGRTHEGSGIGLALVQELARLHGGSVAVESVFGKGTMFRVLVPLGHSHLPQEHIGAARTQASTAISARPFIEEALRWLPDSARRDELGIDDIGTPEHVDREGGRPYILLADDNADMRDYLLRILTTHYEVEAVADGEAALAAIERRAPDLVLADIMMPGLDGLGLLARLRANPRTKTLPIILLSARAGEESRIDGLQAGADDYLIKPFSARELVNRIKSAIRLTQIRREGEERAAADLEAMRCLQEVGNRCARAGNNFEENLDEIIATAIVVMHADKGNLQLLNRQSGTLRIAAQRGFSQPFLQFFAEVNAGEPAVCGAALASGGRLIVEDVTQSVLFAGEPSLNILLGEDVRAVQSTPLIASSGEVFGIISTHYRAPHLPSERDLRLLDLLTRQTADYLERKQAERTQQQLVEELNHRVKNTLASVQAIAQHTLRSTKDPADFAAAFGGRIQSMARVHSLLSGTTWQGVELHDLLRDQVLSGAVDKTQVTVWGPTVHLEPQMALRLALMLHELGTNSNKYGALSKAEGTVTISWVVSNDRLRLKWAERGGPAVKAPLKHGFGKSMIEQSAKGEGGSAELSIEAEGISWEIAVPLSRAAANFGSRPTSPEPDTPGSTISRNRAHVGKKQPLELGGKRVLIVEDEPLIALDVAASLEGAGAKVIGPIGTAEEALALIEGTRLDAALLDGNLRGRAVDDIAAALTRHKVPFLFLTGYGRESLPRAFGKTAMLAKPFSQEQLLVAAGLLLEKPAAVVHLRD
jgi:PAS domain S-box-containing protein